MGLGPTDQSHLEAMKVPFVYNFSSSVVPPPLDWKSHIMISGYWFLDESGELFIYSSETNSKLIFACPSTLSFLVSSQTPTGVLPTRSRSSSRRPRTMGRLSYTSGLARSSVSSVLRSRFVRVGDASDFSFPPFLLDSQQSLIPPP